MRQFFTAQGAYDQALTPSALAWGARRGHWQHVSRDLYAHGGEPLTVLDLALGSMFASDGIGSGEVAGTMLGLDSMRLTAPDFTLPPGSSNTRPGVRRRELAPERIVAVGEFRCTDGLQTMLDLAGLLDDLVWEQALESALRMNLVTIAAIEAALQEMSRARIPGVRRIRRVLALRPAGAPPTESLLETLMVQLARTVPGVPEPDRQVEIVDEDGKCFARVDLAWCRVGAFAELDGQHHAGQPVYDASRETAVVGATGWLCGRWTYHEVRYVPRTSGRRLLRVIEQASRRPFLAPAPTLPYRPSPLS